MPRPSIDYLNARRALKPASGGKVYSRRVKYAPEEEFPERRGGRASRQKGTHSPTKPTCYVSKRIFCEWEISGKQSLTRYHYTAPDYAKNRLVQSVKLRYIVSIPNEELQRFRATNPA